jgi:hypothetical protein
LQNQEELFQTIFNPSLIQQAPYPPSTLKLPPVTKLALSLSKKLTMYATSSGIPHLAIGALAITFLD